MTSESKNVGLFVTCLVDLFRPSVGFAAVKLLEDAGCRVGVPRAQTCCGQPAYNGGDRKDAARIARRVVRAFRDFDYVVAPSGSCAAMLKHHYPALLAEDASLAEPARELAGRTHELTEFLVDVLGVTGIAARYDGICAYHDGCSGLREMGVRAQPRALLSGVAGLELRELPGHDACCGFGGAFCVKYADISNHMVAEKTAEIAASGADTVLAGDLGCLFNIAGKLSRQGAGPRAFHVAEVLAGMAGAAAIGEADAANSEADAANSEADALNHEPEN
ncbi:MAG: (Fe-S)-binding protein [Alphaproteobacteria bacterium]